MSTTSRIIAHILKKKLNYRSLKSVVTKKNIMNKLVNGSVTPSDPAVKAALDRHLIVWTFIFILIFKQLNLKINS